MTTALRERIFVHASHADEGTLGFIRHGDGHILVVVECAAGTKVRVSNALRGIDKWIDVNDLLFEVKVR